MNLSAKILKPLLKRKLATAVLFAASSVAAFATLGDGGGAKKGQSSILIASKPVSYSAKDFSLRSGYNYRGNNLLNTPKVQKTVMLNTVTTFQRGNTTYILPLKKRVILDKVKFSPNSVRY